MKKTNSTLSFVKRILIYSVDGAPKNPHSLLTREREGDVCETRAGAVKWGGGGRERGGDRRSRQKANVYSRQGRGGEEKIDILIGQNNWNERTNERS